MNIVLDNVHPGEVLLEEFLTPLGVSQNRLARSEVRSRPLRQHRAVVHANTPPCAFTEGGIMGDDHQRQTLLI